MIDMFIILIVVIKVSGYAHMLEFTKHVHLIVYYTLTNLKIIYMAVCTINGIIYVFKYKRLKRTKT